jgi:hypothetical protein
MGCDAVANELFWIFFAANGISKLYSDVRSCGYDDVHVMWSMLQHSHFPSDPPKRHRLTRSFG